MLELTAQRLRTLLHYEPENGVFTRLVELGSNARLGAVAGYKAKNGYVQLRVDGRLYYAHRLAWLHVYGQWPVNTVDHIDGDPSNTRISNLRDVTHAVNIQNRTRPNANNPFKLIGVTKTRNRFLAQIKINGVQTYIGSFDTAEEAHAAFLERKRREHPGCSI